MQARRLENFDRDKIYQIWEKFYNYPFPDLDNPKYVLQAIVENENKKIITAGYLQLTSEIITTTNKDVNAFERAKALKQLHDYLICRAQKLGFEDFHVFAEHDNATLQFLRKLGFIDCTGVPMVKLL